MPMASGRPKINRELEQAKDRLTRINAGLLACYETIEIGNQKKAALERKISQLKGDANGG